MMFLQRVDSVDRDNAIMNCGYCDASGFESKVTQVFPFPCYPRGYTVVTTPTDLPFRSAV